MKQIFLEFIRRGLIACGFGPLVLAILYFILNRQELVEYLAVNQVCIGIFSLYTLAFIAGGMNIVYQIERLPLMIAILIHGGVLYITYLCTYLVNDWLALGVTPILVFTGIFVFCYVLIWVIIYSTTKKDTDKLNKILKEKQQKLPPA